jgi:hypothetical protein
MIDMIMVRDASGNECNWTKEQIEEYAKRDKPEGTVIFYAAFSATKLLEFMRDGE